MFERLKHNKIRPQTRMVYQRSTFSSNAPTLFESDSRAHNRQLQRLPSAGVQESPSYSSREEPCITGFFILESAMFHSKELLVIVLVQVVITLILSAATPSSDGSPSLQITHDDHWLDPHYSK
jgi:hypothetical protein